MHLPQHLTKISANKASIFAQILRLGLNIKQIQQVYEYAQLIKNEDTGERNFIVIICDEEGEKAFQYEGRALTHDDINSQYNNEAFAGDIIDSADFEYLSL